MIRFIVLLSFLLLDSSLLLANSDRCLFYKEVVKKATVRYFGNNYPWWYNLGLYKTETNCRWLTSMDGHGSIGFAQLTPKYVDSYLLSLFPDYKRPYSSEYHYAFAYFFLIVKRQAYCKKLWNAYQCYNRTCSRVNTEAKVASCVWRRARGICEKNYKRNVCVWKVNNECKQYRTNCDINYTYSAKVFINGSLYREGIDLEPFF